MTGTKTFKAALVAGLALMAVSSTALAQEAASVAPAALTKQDVEKIVHDYILENPEIIREAALRLQAKEEEAKAAAQRQLMTQYQEQIFSETAPYLGAKDAKIVLVEFLDYHCGYCRKAGPVVHDLVAKDKDVKVINHIVGWQGDGAILGAKAAYAAQIQGKFTEAHEVLLNIPAPITLDKIETALKGSGIDLDKLKADLEGAQVKQKMEEAQALAQILGVRGTPTFMKKGVDQVVPGYLDAERFEQFAYTPASN